MSKREGSKRSTGPVGLGAGRLPQGERAREGHSAHPRDLERAQHELLAHGPARNKGDSQADFDGAQQALRRVEHHPNLQVLPFETSLDQNVFHDSPGARTEFTHQQWGVF
jgi:hypothetical protein